MHPKNAIHIMLFALGFLSIGTQIYLTREFMMVFSDNELTVGLVLAIWLLVTGSGSFLGKYFSTEGTRVATLPVLLAITGLLPIVMILATGILKALWVPYGSLAGLGQTAIACLTISLPFCLLNGIMFTFLSSRARDSSPGKCYAMESLGSMASGALINFGFLWFLGPFRSMTVITAGYMLLVCYFTYRVASRKHVIMICATGIVAVIFSAFFDFRDLTHRFLYPAQQVISDTETPYGQVVVTTRDGQYNFFENGVLIFSTGNEISNEENVHYAMVQHSHPERVLLISGGYSGTLAEILKYHPVQVDYVELNPALMGIVQGHSEQFPNPAVHSYSADARRFIRNSETTYDMVLVNLPAPSTLQLNRYYSVEFMQEIRRKMSSGGVIAYSLPTGADYVSEYAGRINSILWHTLRQSFSETLIIPGFRNYFLASDSSLSYNVPGLIESRDLKTLYVNKYYLDAGQLKERGEYIRGRVSTLSGSPTPSGSAIVNRDFTPVAVWHHLSWWLSLHDTSLTIIIPAFCLVFFLLMLTLNPLNAGLFAGGFTLASLEIIIIFGLQVLTGYLFQAIGAIFMIFMLGLAVGSALGTGAGIYQEATRYGLLQLTLAILAVLIPYMILQIGKAAMSNAWINIILGISAFIASVLVGMEYNLAANLSKQPLQKTIGSNYAAEMFGAAAGAFAATLFLVPFLGIVKTGMVLAIVNVVTATVWLFARKFGRRL